MNKKLHLALSVLQTAIGFLLVLSFVVLAIAGYEVKQYIAPFVVGLVFLVIGTANIVKLMRKK